MAQCSRVIPAEIDEVFHALVDARAFPEWVVGARRVVEVDPEWPQAGSWFRHETGPWFARHRDRTVVVDIEPPRLLRLRAYVRPTGIAAIVIELSPHPDGTLVRLGEHIEGGALSRIWNPLLERMLLHRNRESLRRLEAVVVDRSRQRASGE